MPDGGTLSPTLGGTPNTYTVRPANTTAVRCFGSRLGRCREVIFYALDDNSQSTAITIGDSSANATAGNAQGTTRGPGEALVLNDIDPYDWYVATDGDSNHGVTVEATK